MLVALLITSSPFTSFTALLWCDVKSLQSLVFIIFVSCCFFSLYVCMCVCVCVCVWSGVLPYPLHVFICMLVRVRQCMRYVYMLCIVGRWFALIIRCAPYSSSLHSTFFLPFLFLLQNGLLRSVYVFTLVCCYPHFVCACARACIQCSFSHRCYIYNIYIYGKVTYSLHSVFVCSYCNLYNIV